MKCPVCDLQLTNPIPSFCSRCAWDVKNDITLNTFLSPIPEKDLSAYRQRLELARKNWKYLQVMKKEQIVKSTNPQAPQKIWPTKKEDHGNEDRDQGLSNSQTFSDQPTREKEQINTYHQVSSEKKSMDDRDVGYVPTRQKCPLCGIRNNPDDTFQCRICGKDYLCRDHFVKEQRCCKDCSTIMAIDGRFIIHKDNIVEDTLSGLEWVVMSRFVGQPHIAINNLSIGGGGWRLPTCNELSGLYNKNAGNSNLTPLLQISTKYAYGIDCYYNIFEGNAGLTSNHITGGVSCLAVRRAKDRII